MAEAPEDGTGAMDRLADAAMSSEVLAVILGGLGWLTWRWFLEYKRQTETPELRRAMAARLQSEHVFDNYHRRLTDILDRAAITAGEGMSWRETGRGVAFCFSLACVYTGLIGIISWFLLGQDRIGDVKIIHPDFFWSESIILTYVYIASKIVILVLFLWFIFIAFSVRNWEKCPVQSNLHTPMNINTLISMFLKKKEGIRFSLLIIVIVTISFMLVYSVIVQRYSDYIDGDFIALLILCPLPFLNAVSDLLSLRLSQWLGRKIEQNQRHLVLTALGTGLIDLAAAAGFVALVTGGICFVVAALAEWMDISDGLQFAIYVDRVFAHPMTTGVWGTIMVFTTLVPTVYHLRMAVHAIYLHSIHGPKNWAARILADDRPEHVQHWTWVRFWLAFGWPVSIATALFLLWLIYEGFLAFGVDLPDQLHAWCHFWIEAGRRAAGGV